jgi:hypothetical protein
VIGLPACHMVLIHAHDHRLHRVEDLSMETIARPKEIIGLSTGVIILHHLKL